MLTLLLVACLMQDPAPEDSHSPEDLAAAARVMGLEFTAEELEQMRKGVQGHLRNFARLREFPLRWDEPIALGFSPLVPGVQLRARELEPTPIAIPAVERPRSLDSLAFADIPTLAALVRSREVTCVELAELFLDRLERHDEELNCVVTLTRDRAMRQAEALDAELDDGKYRGLLHGIPYGAKDLLAAEGYPTTWGAHPFREQVIDEDAEVIERLDAAGAVLVAKLSLGALAMGDEWFDGRTNNPWNPARGSSGSSAGPASATAAGCVPFAIGSETLGSIVSPSVRCGNSSLRPTFGRISRAGAMPLSWTMDKLGPMGRSALDCAIVFSAIHGADGKDLDAVTRPFTLSGPVDVTGWKVGFFPGAADDESYGQTLQELRDLGVELVEIELPEFPVRDMLLILQAEAACAFDELTRDGRDDELVQQGNDAWPNSFRVARMIPAVEYLRANRMRSALCRAMDGAMAEVEGFVHPPFAGGSLSITNLTGHPCFVAPSGPARQGRPPRTVCFTGQLHGESRLLALVTAWQAHTSWEEAHPSGY